MPDPVTLKLTYAQMSIASHVATMRHLSNMRKGLKPKYGASNGEGAWEINHIGCCGELAVARYANLFWCGSLNDFGARDVGGLIDARSVTQQHHKLILHREDRDGVPYVLVWVRADLFDLLGWVFAEEGKRAEFWADPTGGRPAFFVPQDTLRPMPELLEWLKAARLW